MIREQMRVLVVGLGATGVAAAEVCRTRGARVTGTDSRTEEQLGATCDRLARREVTLLLGGHDAVNVRDYDIIVVSPGVPPLPILTQAEQLGVPIVSEVELSWSLLPRGTPVFAVGGTNGKSTTTELLAALLRVRDRRVFAGGNLGEPLALHVDEGWDAVVLEVSSFQMERVANFRPNVSILLNITDDHLDRYASFDDYARAKGNAFARQGTGDYAVIPGQDPLCARQAMRGQGTVVTFGGTGATVEVEAGAIVDHRVAASFDRRDIRLVGHHNALNVAASLAAAGSLSSLLPEPAEVRRVLAEFSGLPHRMNLVLEHDGVRFYDDSKGTNVGAAVTAVLGVPADKVVLIGGGRDKGGAYDPLAHALRARGRGCVLIGEASARMAEAIGDAVPVEMASNMSTAVRKAARLARPGDAVLLSPACSSYDMFRDYKHRGDEFVQAVRGLLAKG